MQDGCWLVPTGRSGDDPRIRIPARRPTWNGGHNVPAMPTLDTDTCDAKERWSKALEKNPWWGSGIGQRLLRVRDGVDAPELEGDECGEVDRDESDDE